MNAQLPAFPRMSELNVSNDLMGDQQALQDAWERDGYWFFRDVLNKEVIGRVRSTYLSYLVELGALKSSDSSGEYVIGDLSKVPTVNVNMTLLNQRRVEKMISTEPSINAFFHKIFHCDPFWVPITVHRTVGPGADRSRPRLEFIHHDGIYNDGLPFLICWIPLDRIDAEVGGLAVVEGLHQKPTLHRKEGMRIHPIRQEDVPPNTWRGTTYRPGDVLLMSLGTPHTGITNWSKDRFRLSMDTRVMPSSGKVPLVGTIVEATTQLVVIRDARGEHTLRFQERSFVRGFQGNQLPLSEVPAQYPVGLEVIAAFEGDRVLNLRPQT